MDNITTFEAHLDKYHGKEGTESRAKYDVDSLAFRLGAMLQEARKETECIRTKEFNHSQVWRVNCIN